jgi:hypothetical protein
MKFVRDPHSPPFRGRWGSGLGLGIGESHEQAPGLRRSNWEQLFEAALLESDTVVLGQRFQDANDAIMEEIEDPRSQTDRPPRPRSCAERDSRASQTVRGE